MKYIIIAIAEGMDPEVRGFDNLKEAEDFYVKQVLNEDKYFNEISLQEETSTPGIYEVAASVQHLDGELYAGHEEPYILDGNENKGLRDFLFNK